jgi:hypothetical protein
VGVGVASGGALAATAGGSGVGGTLRPGVVDVILDS